MALSVEQVLDERLEGVQEVEGELYWVGTQAYLTYRSPQNELVENPQNPRSLKPGPELRAIRLDPEELRNWPLGGLLVGSSLLLKRPARIEGKIVWEGDQASFERVEHLEAEIPHQSVAYEDIVEAVNGDPQRIARRIRVYERRGWTIEEKPDP